ncbi:MAG TPA: hypothetical protein DCY93_00450 [Firmicutes bacterium]|nr:hypothetical protein [Bacillota bacterium]
MSNLAIFLLLTDSQTSAPTSTGTSNSSGNFFSDFFDKIVNYFKENGVTLMLRILLALLIIIIGHYLIKLLTFVLRKSLSHPRKNGKKLDRGIITFSSSVFKFILSVALVFIVFAVLNIPLNSWASVVSAAVLAIGLALQDTIANFSNGVFLLSSHNFVTGDYISVDGVEGTVMEFNMMSIVLLSPDNKRIIIPNSTVAKSIITNYSSEPTRRISLNFDVSYDSDINKCRKIILNTVNSEELVLKDPEPNLNINSFESSSIRLVLKCYVNNADYWTVIYALNEKVFEALKKAGIDIPFDQLDINIKDNTTKDNTKALKEHPEIKVKPLKTKKGDKK